jgi:SHS family lactate transporter-like MFS transporter
VLSGILQEGYAMGYLLAAVAYYFFFPIWGWRPLFFLGGLPALLAFYVRFQVKESEVWQESKHESWRELGRAIVSHWKVFLYIVLLMTMMNFVSHGTQDLYPTVLESEHHLAPKQQAIVTAISMVGAILGGLVFGLFSDRFGRRRSIVIALLLAVVMIPLWAYAPSAGLLMLGAFLMQFMVQGAWGVIPAHLSELAPNSVRGFLPGFGYQCGVLFAGTIAYIEAVYSGKVSLQTAMALTALTVFIGAAIVAAAGRENRGVSFRNSTRLE